MVMLGMHVLFLKLEVIRMNQQRLFMARKAWAMDVGDSMLLARDLIDGIKTVNWLTAINYEWFNKIREERSPQ